MYEIRQAFSVTRRNARLRGIPFNLTYDDLDILLRKANGHCMVTGIAFDFTKMGKGVRRPWTASIDRIDSSKGYDLKNCRLVCCAVNLAMNIWGEGVLRKIAHALVDYEYQLSQNRNVRWVLVPRKECQTVKAFAQGRYAVNKSTLMSFTLRTTNECRRRMLNLPVTEYNEGRLYPVKVMEEKSC